jgi:hypothetical protein
MIATARGTWGQSPNWTFGMRPTARILVIQAGDRPQICANCVVVSIGASPATDWIRSSASPHFFFELDQIDILHVRIPLQLGARTYALSSY